MDILSDEIVLMILRHVDVETIEIFSKTNTYYNNLCNDVYFWSKRIVETTNYSKLLFEELWEDIEKYKGRSMTGVDIFKNIIYDKTSDTLNHLDTDYIPNLPYISFLNDLCTDLNFPRSRISEYLDKAVISIIELYKFLKLKHSWSGTCQYQFSHGRFAGTFCNKKTPFSCIYCICCCKRPNLRNTIYNLITKTPESYYTIISTSQKNI